MTFNERFQLGERIGSGLCSDVYQAVDLGRNGVVVAVKVTDQDDDVPPHNSRNELKALLRLRELYGEKTQKENHIVQLMDSYQYNGQIKFVFEFFKYDLQGLVFEQSRKKVVFGDRRHSFSRVNRVGVERSTEIVKGIALGLSFIHSAGFIHRDIKPANIMFKDLESPPVIIDFGISWCEPDNYGKEPEAAKITDIATGRYKAPELLFSVRRYSSAVDIWALGIVATLLFSNDCEPIFIPDTDRSDLALLGSILETFGSPSPEKWPEACESSAFQAMSFISSEPKPVGELLPKASENDAILKVFPKMMVYESKRRMTALQIYNEL
ncbi:unnamed protein product [Kuraishia capsulata CBS 1993]|uniref:Protein kinase domain-containing protein n=1 Tax=Kuraishia capsulata CBS 1993 TaxID=1382522 RepID=W6MIE4_9ASCO|nr:uncharacterized protein KUCA_T00002200001 [Kuraishia capsulata CBS 1993]CDK26229.1 unnamed protein product [Kuraishia capsulata CBS 1993]